MEIMKAVLGLEDGEFVIGEGFGVEGERAGEARVQYPDDRVHGILNRSQLFRPDPDVHVPPYRELWRR